MRSHGLGAAFVGCLILSGILHAAVLPLMARVSPSAPPPPIATPQPYEELAIDTLGDDEPPPLGVADGSETGHGALRPPAPTEAPPSKPAGQPLLTAPDVAHPANEPPSFPAAAPSASAPPETEQERLRKLREAVERAMLSHDDAGDGEPARGSPDGVVGGKGSSSGGGFGYLGGWFSSLISVRQLRLTAEEKQQAAAVGVITIADGQITAASLSQPGSVPAYNQAVSGALAGLVGRKVPPNSLGEFPSGTFTLRLKPR
jgi:hypothetical protein